MPEEEILELTDNSELEDMKNLAFEIEKRITQRVESENDFYMLEKLQEDIIELMEE